MRGPLQLFVRPAKASKIILEKINKLTRKGTEVSHSDLIQTWICCRAVNRNHRVATQFWVMDV